MLTLAELLALLARANSTGDDALTDDERSTLNETLADLSAFSDDDLTAISEALHAVADVVLDAVTGSDDEPGRAPTADEIELLEYVAVVSEAITAEQDERDGADQAAIDRAAELADRIRGGAGDDGEPAAAAGGDDGAGGDEPAGDDAPAGGEDAPAEPEAVAAGAGTRVGRVAARRPRNTQPRPSGNDRGVAPLVASANVPNATMGADLSDPERLGLAFADTLGAMGSMVLRDGMRIPIAGARLEFPEASMLSLHDVRRNEQLIQQHASLEAVTASGTICAPAVPRYDLPQVAVADRPVRDGLTRFGSERGGSIIPAPLLLDDVADSSTIWTTVQNASAAQNPSVRKPCLRMACGDDETVIPYAIVQCLEIDNWNARTWPERVERFVSLAAAWQARMAESRLLTRIGALSTKVTVPQVLGTARDVLRALDRAGSAMRNSHRMLPNTPLRWMAPATLRDEMRADLTASMTGGSTDERLAVADATIDGFFAARHINVSWFLDGEAGQVFPTQSDGVLRGWHPNVVSYLFPEGTFILLDGGELNLGVVRDSTLNSSNDFQMFQEFWEEVAFVGVVSYRITMALCPDGSSAGTVAPSCTDLATS